MIATKDYLLNYLHLTENGKQKLAAEMKTEEFGLMRSRMLDATKDSKMNQTLLNSLADEVIDDYEQRLENTEEIYNIPIDLG